MQTPSKLRNARGAAALVALVCAALALTAGAWAQVKKPISKKGLINAVRINGLTTREFVREIEARGVDFEMTAGDESEIRAAGARPEVVEAARANYRPAAARPAVASNPRPSTPTSTTPAAGVPPGPPLSKNEVVTMLQGGIPPARVEQFVEVRGVSFQVTPEVAREITAAGGNRSLVGAITERSLVASADDDDGDDGDGSSPFGAGGGEEADAGRPSYESLIDQAQTSFVAQDYNSAGNYLKQALELDPSRPHAFQLVGSMALIAGNFQLAEQSMRAAMDRGGSGVFRVAHDHDGAFGQYCQGSFFVSKSGVSFVANDGRDTFEAEDANIKEAKINAFVGAKYSAFHVKPIQKINGRDNFNFAPISTLKPESELLIRLIKAY